MDERTGGVRILHLEDNDDDAALVRASLRGAGIACEIERVPGRPGFEEALGRGGYDLIVSDFALPGYTGASALRLAREKAPGVPFIFVSGTLGEDAAIEALLGGATDYVLKTGDMRRLVPAVQRALRELRERRERERLERQFMQAQKMEAVGRLAGGVAHDFNNLLTSILGLAQLNIMELPAGSQLRKDLEEIEATVLRAADLTRQLLAFSRKQIVEPRVVDLNRVLAGVEKMLKRVIGEDVELAVKAAPGLRAVRVDPGQIEQLLVNMAVNARDAMPEGGRLVIETANALLDDAFVDAHPGAKPGRFAALTVRDTGVGMTEEVKARVFEPFFTTKGPDKGTGLGLATCYGIVQQNAGHIEIDTAPGRGTAFTVYLPACDGRPEEPRLRPESGKRGGETVLVVEDEASLRRLTCRILRDRGYEVLEAAGLEGASFHASGERGREIRLLIADILIPGSSGREVAETVRRLRPAADVLFVSGHADDVLRQRGLLPPEARFLAKPFSSQDLARKVREILDGRR